MQEIELLAPGVDLNHPEKGRYYQNVYRKNGGLTVRPGFGQLAQFDSTMGCVDDGQTDGYSKCLGTRAMRTNFGHIQIISVHITNSYTSETGGLWSPLYSVDIYDVTTDERWEEVIYRHTSERSRDVTPIDEWHGIYESHKGKEYGSWRRAWDEDIFFEEAFDVLFFGSKTLGMRMYIPSDFNGNRRKQVESTPGNEASLPYSESCVVVPVSPADGSFFEAYTYLEESTFPDPVDAAMVGARLAIARDHDIFFSDDGRPASFIAINSIAVPSEAPITAIESIADNLLIFTARETYLYQPSIATLASAGRLSRVSEHVGCLGPNAISRSDNMLIWCDQNGVYMSTGGMGVKKVSENIQTFFDDRVSNPLTSRDEARNMTNSQPRSNFDSNDMSGISMAYDHLTQTTFMSVPAQNIMWVFQQGAWYLWNLESVMSDSGQVKAVNNIINAKVSAIEGRVFLHGGVDHYEHTVGGPKTGSFYIAELGRGGALDRSVHPIEDNRNGTGCFVEDLAPLGARFVIGPPLNSMYPLYLVTDTVTPDVKEADLEFTFDDTLWEVDETGGLLNLEIPVERELGNFAIADVTGNTIHINYVSGVATAMVAGSKNLLCKLKFTPLAESKTLGLSKVFANYTDSTPSVNLADFVWWSPSGMLAKHTADDTAQQVDWVLKSGQLAAKSEGQIKLRTIYSKTKTHGNSTLNVQFASDWTDYKGQSADTIHTTSKTASRTHELFGDAAATWGDSVIVDEEHYDTVSSSLSIKGEHVSVMVYGAAKDKAEEVVVDSVIATYKHAGGRRRKGR